MKKIVAFVLMLIFSISLLTTSFALVPGNYIAAGFLQPHFCNCPTCHDLAVIVYGPWTYVGPNTESSWEWTRTRRIECLNGHYKRLPNEYKKN